MQLPNQDILNTYLKEGGLDLLWTGVIHRDFNIDCDVITFTNQAFKQRIIYYCQSLTKTRERDAVTYLEQHIKRQKNNTLHIA